MTYNGGDKIAVTPFSQYPLPTQCPSAELSRAFAVISNHLPKANTTDFWCREFLPLPIPRKPRCWFNADFGLHLGKVGWRLGWAGGLCLLSSSCQPLFFCFFLSLLSSFLPPFPPNQCRGRELLFNTLTLSPDRRPGLEGAVHPVQEEKRVTEADFRSSHIRQPPRLSPLRAGHPKTWDTVARHKASPESASLPCHPQDLLQTPKSLQQK